MERECHVRGHHSLHTVSGWRDEAAYYFCILRTQLIAAHPPLRSDISSKQYLESRRTQTALFCTFKETCSGFQTCIVYFSTLALWYTGLRLHAVTPPQRASITEGKPAPTCTTTCHTMCPPAEAEAVGFQWNVSYQLHLLTGESNLWHPTPIIHHT